MFGKLDGLAAIGGCQHNEISPLQYLPDQVENDGVIFYNENSLPRRVGGDGHRVSAKQPRITLPLSLAGIYTKRCSILLTKGKFFGASGYLVASGAGWGRRSEK